MVRQVVEDVETFSGLIGVVETLSRIEEAEIGIAQLNALHLIEFGVERTLVGVNTLLDFEGVTARRECLVVVCASLIFGVTVPLAEISADDVINLQQRELGVDEVEFGEIVAQRCHACVAVRVSVLNEFRQYPAACDTRTLSALFVSLTGRVKTNGTGPAQLTQYRHACSHVYVGYAHFTDCSSLRDVHHKTFYVHKGATLNPQTVDSVDTCQCQSAGICEPRQVHKFKFGY